MLWSRGRVSGLYEATLYPGLPNQADIPCRVWFHMTQQAQDRLADLKVSSHHKWAVFLPSITVAPFPLHWMYGLCHYWASQFIRLIQQKANLRASRTELKSSSFSDLPAEPTHHEAMIARAKKRKGWQKPWTRKDRTAFLMGKLLDHLSCPIKIILSVPTWKKTKKRFILVMF